jgi:cellulose biosynthesis protein BcsQ
VNNSGNRDRRARIFTFYSYKGGVGRSMAVANVATLLSSMGRKVLVVDWDLEAPGIERYFEDSGSSGPADDGNTDTPGVVDLIHGVTADVGPGWRDCRLLFQPLTGKPAVAVIPAGRRDEDYLAKMQDIEWARLFREKNLAAYLENMRTEWTGEYDVVLIDSRTGVNDLGGICTIYLPAILIAMFTANQQSVYGVIDVIRRAREARKRLPYDRGLLVAVPVPSRDESKTNHDQAVQWRRFFAKKLADFYRDFLPPHVDPFDAASLLRIPNMPYWSFGERLPVTREYIGDPNSLSYHYALLARLIDSGLNWNRMVEGPAP